MMLNSLYDQNQLFKESRNADVGRSLSDVLMSEDYVDYQSAYVGFRQFRKPKLIFRGDHYTEYQFESRSGECKWILRISESTGNVVSWRYASEASRCKKQRFYEGPW